VSSRNDLVAKAKAITEREMAVYSERTHQSQIATERARKVMPAGVPSSFQAYDPWPVVVKHAAGSQMIDVDDNVYVDYDMGFGALFAGHMNPAVDRAVREQLDHGTLYVTPCELNAEVGEILADRYGFPMWRPTNSGTEATHDAIRLARGVTGARSSSRSRAATTATTTR
jgi:glutamate-1-semialdehyde 2,1-aminomutase